MPKKFREEFKTYHNVFDRFTDRNIFKLISEGHFDGIQGQLTLGKEANIFIAKKGDEKVIVKIYRLQTCDFNRMYDYIKYDPRYHYLKKRRREIIFAWAQREFRNLLKAREIGVNVPKPIAIKFNILVMELIGDPAPKLKDMPPKNPEKFFDEIISMMKKMYKNNLVHADLSHFNILNDNDVPYIIDWSQCTPAENPNAEEYLKRDVRNVCSYFRKIGVEASEEMVMKRIKTK
ncbi:serine protein kinase RIO [Candidatus Woesearchaeota archaeon]|nr:serine protein kinase RIO [Candidatus Woesearchaeota archaeon]